MRRSISQRIINIALPLVLAYLVVGMVAKGMGWL
jgi:hypothetical protein